MRTSDSKANTLPPRRRLLVGFRVFVFLCFSICPGVPAFAQVTNLDKGRFIDGLQREGMSELLLHLVEVEPPKDPVEAQIIKIAQFRLRVDELATKASESTDGNEQQELHRQRGEEFEQLTKAYQDLIEQHNGHEQRPIWQTDFAELLLDVYLWNIQFNASEFYDLGVPTRQQREAFERMIPQAYENLTDASQRFFELQAALPREDEAKHRERVNSGVWARMMEDYYGFRTPYFLGQASYYASLLPDDHAYYRGLGQNKRVPFQAKTPADERKRLRSDAVTKLEPLAADATDRRGARMTALTFTGRAKTLNGAHAEAIVHFDEVIGANKGDLVHLCANLAKGRAMAAMGQGLQAMDHLTRVEFHPLATQFIYMRLLVVDQQYQVLRKISPESAYDPYMNLLADQNIPEADREVLKVQVIYPRWAAVIPHGADLKKQPAMVLAAIGELARMEGQDPWQRAQLAEQEGRTAEAEPLKQEANAKFDRAIVVLTSLLARPNLDPKIAAKGLLNLAFAEYFKDPMNPAVLLKAAKLWTDMAETTPDAPEAVEALGNAEVALRPWFDNPLKPPGVREAYLRTTEMLFKQFPHSLHAHNARLYYAYNVLLPAGKYTDAAAMFRDVPQGHPDYPNARREWILALQKVYEHAAAADKPKVLAESIETAQTVLTEIERDLPAALPSDVGPLRDAQGWVTLTLFDFLVADGKPIDALKLMDGFEETFEDMPLLVEGMYERKIIQFAQADRNDELAEQASEMMLKAPNNAAPVINTVLNKLEGEIEHLRNQANDPANIAVADRLRTQAAGRAKTAATLAQLLLEWAKNQGFTEEEILPYQLPSVKALRISGEVDKALEMIEPIARNNSFKDNATVIQEYGEALFATGLKNGQVTDRQKLIAAAEQFKVLIFGYAQGPFPPTFWNAWMRWFQVAEALNEGTQIIPQKIRELRAFDPNLGGEPYSTEFRRLDVKYSAANR